MAKDKKIIKSILLIIVLLFFISVQALGIVVTKSFRYDFNTVAGYTSNYHNYQYQTINDNYKNKGYNDYRVGSGWNYIRYERLYYYGP